MPKFSTGYLTPQSQRKKHMSSKTYTGSTENLHTGFDISDDVFKKLMSDPVKRNLILNVISSEKATIEAYKKSRERKKECSPLQKALKKPCESPTQLLRRRVLEQQKNAQMSDNHSDSDSNSRPSSRQSIISSLSTASTVPSPVMFNKIMDGVIAFVEVKTGLKDRSAPFKTLMTSMGAVVREKFKTDITHVIFKEGSFTTYQRANLIKARLVSVLWVEACKNTGVRVPERNYPAIYTGVYDRNESVLCSQLQKDYEEVVNEEFEKSLISGQSATSINRRRTLMTPNSKEVASITRRSLPSAKLKENQYSDVIFSDDDSDLDPIIDGEIIESDSHEFEDFTRNKTKNIHQQTNHQPEDMELTNMNGEAFLFNVKTPKIGKTPLETSNIESYDFINDSLYRRRTGLLENVRNTTNLTMQPDQNNDKLTSQNSNNILTPKHLHILSKNVAHKTPDATTNNLEKEILFEKTIDNNTSATSQKATEKSNSTNMSSLRISDNSNKSSSNNKKSNDKITSHKPEDKLDGTNMSSMRVSDNSNKSSNVNKKSSSKHDSFKTNLSFSPVESTVLDSIIKTLGNNYSFHSTDEKENSLRKKGAKIPRRSNSKQNQDQNIQTPNAKPKDISHEHVTLRKKYVQATVTNPEDTDVDVLLRDQITQNLLLQSPQITEDSTDAEDEKTKKSRKRKTMKCLNKENENINEENMELVQTNKKNITRKSSVHSNKIIDHDESFSSKTSSDNNNLHKPRKTINSLKHLTCCSNDMDDTTRKRGSFQSLIKEQEKTPKSRKTLARDLNKEFSEIDEEQPKENKTLRSQRHTIAMQEKESNKVVQKDISNSKRKTIAESSNEQNTVSQTKDDHQSPTKKLKSSPENKIDTRSNRRSTRRQTISSSAVKNKPCNSKIIRRTLSSTNINVISPNEKNSRRLRKLYSPNNVQSLLVSDDTERNEKRRAKKGNDSEVFIKPIILSKKASELLSKNNLSVDRILNPKQTELELPSKTNKNENKKKEHNEKYNSDDDEQVELKNEILNRKKIETRSKVSTSKSPLFQTPKRNNKTNSSIKKVVGSSSSKKLTASSQKCIEPLRKPTATPKSAVTPRKLTIKLTPIVSTRNRRSSIEFQSKPQSTRKRVKIDAGQKASIVCTKMHKEEVQTFTQIVKKLGKFMVEDEVSNKTTHLVIGEPKRTINMLRAIARGCWILKKEWLYRSLECSKWLPEEDFEETDFSPAVQTNRMYRQAFGSSYTMDILQDCGPIYVTKGSIPRCSDLRELIHLCKGKTTKVPRNASIVIGEYMKADNVKCVSEMWILDCISSNKKLPFKKYLLNSQRKSVFV